jgi:hypothetical protein
MERLVSVEPTFSDAGRMEDLVAPRLGRLTRGLRLLVL